MKLITSRNNEHIINAKKLQNKKYRDVTSQFCFEGAKLFREALCAGVELKQVFALPSAFEACPELSHLPCAVTVTEPVYKKLTLDHSPDGIFCVARKPKSQSTDGQSKFLVVSVRDPGNVGTIIRSALAFGIDELIFTSDCADIYSPKVVRSAMGALFYQGIRITQDLNREIDNLKKSSYNLFAAALSEHSLPLNSITINQKSCFLVGNEGHGLSDEIIALCDQQVIIPISSESESLNAAVAASVLMWEMKRNTINECR